MRQTRKHQASSGTYRRHAPRSFGFAERKKRRVRLVPILVLGACILSVLLIVRLWDYRQAQQEYAAYAALPTLVPEASEPVAALPALTEYQAPTPTENALQQQNIIAATHVPATPMPTAQPFFSEQVAKLKKQNSDAVAWIEIPDTTVQYPVAQGKDNEYYQTHTFAKKKRATGSIFLDAWNSKSFADFNTVVYGHHMKDGSMFTPLLEYNHDSFLRNHKYIVVTLENSKKTYKVFAAYECDDSVDFRGFRVKTDRDRINFLKRIVHDSVFTTNAEATPQDRILTLATCTGGERDRYWIVHAVLVEDVTVMPK